MTSPSSALPLQKTARDLLDDFEKVRARSLDLIDPLSDADATVQSMEDASPAKWHMGHTTWFFETLILCSYDEDYTVFNERFAFLFNSYYEQLGPRQPRPQRGMLTRPTLDDVIAYRRHVDTCMKAFLTKGIPDNRTAELIELGLHHEMQHQELLLTDILHLFAQNPLKPAYRPSEPLVLTNNPPPQADWCNFEGGIMKMGHEGETFAFDCETPAHDQIIRPFKLSSHPVTNGEWIQFMEAGGYENPLHWLSDGWTTVQQEAWHAPLYWQQEGEVWWHMTLRGYQPVDLEAPVSQISYFEADAYARWAGKRLPTEFEWEYAATELGMDGNFADGNRLRPKRASQNDADLQQMYGDVWEWTSSPYVSYPGFKPAEGAVSEYNGKFMSGQFVLKGGACTTPKEQMRPTYRNFFYPHQRWQFSGLRLAEDL
ncbi:MAG: ergothioneine biosynthesis protein EgtB [Sneathiella sp.]